MPEQPTPEQLEAYQRLSEAEVVRLVLCLLVEEAVKKQRDALCPYLPVDEAARVDGRAV
jgi:hypothetical protein